MNYKNKSLLGLECKSDKIIKSKAIKFIVKKYYFIRSNNGNIFYKFLEKYCKRKFKCYKNKKQINAFIELCYLWQKKSTFIKNKEVKFY